MLRLSRRLRDLAFSLLRVDRRARSKIDFLWPAMRRLALGVEMRLRRTPFLLCRRVVFMGPSMSRPRVPARVLPLMGIVEDEPLAWTRRMGRFLGAVLLSVWLFDRWPCDLAVGAA